MAKPRVNLTRFHGVFAPDSAHRAQVTPTKRGTGNKVRTADAPEESLPAERRSAMTFSYEDYVFVLSGKTWAQRLKRVFNIELEGIVRVNRTTFIKAGSSAIQAAS